MATVTTSRGEAHPFDKGFIQWDDTDRYVPVVIISISPRTGRLTVVLLDSLPTTTWEKGDRLTVESHTWRPRERRTLQTYYL